jgi:hypothetical protein
MLASKDNGEWNGDMMVIKMNDMPFIRIVYVIEYKVFWVEFFFFFMVGGSGVALLGRTKPVE